MNKRLMKLLGQKKYPVTENKISYQSPLGSAIMGRKEQEIIAISSPNGEYQIKILKIF